MPADSTSKISAPRAHPPSGWFARYRRGWPGLRLLAVALACLGIWAGEPLHYFVAPPALPADQIADARITPPDMRLDEISHYALGIKIKPLERLPEAAGQIRQGELPNRDFPPFGVSAAAYPEDLRQGGSTQQLIVAGLGIEQILLRAYEDTGDIGLLELASARILDFARDEATRWRPLGLLWNDHAVAARIGVIAQWWRHFRASPLYREDTARTVLTLVERSGALLAKPDHFTAATNHGVMQNLALLQIAVAFPTLPEVPAWRREALRRLKLQLPYYVAREGFILEHSADYQLLGTELLAQSARLMNLLGETVPPLLAARLPEAQRISDLLLRPDGTLPLTGNTALAASPGTARQTGAGQAVSAVPPPRPANSALLAPLSGYALWWAGDAETQILTAWSRFPGHGHKHADEPSVQLWHGGTSWLAASGYWPYDAPGYADANGWPGSNAPHLVGEPATSERQLIAHAASQADAPLRMIDVERRGGAGFAVRRQVLQIDPHNLLVIDFAHGAPGKTLRTIWTADPRARIRIEGARQAVATRADDVAGTMQVGYDGTPDLLHGSFAPFAGWVVAEREPRAADALVFERDAGDSRAVYQFNLAEPTAMRSAPALSADATPERWRVTLSLDGQPHTLARDGMRLRLEMPGGPARESMLQPVDNRDPERAAMAQALARAGEEFPKWRDLSAYRLRLIQLMLALALGLETVLLILAGWRGGERNPASSSLNAIVLAGWGGLVAWALLRYLR